MASKHLTVGELLRLLDSDASREQFALRALAHLREVAGSPVDLAPLLAAPPEPAGERRRRLAAERAARVAARRRADEIATDLAADRRRAEKDLARLLDVEAEQRDALIVAARTRFRSPVLAELLLQEARIALRLDPAVAVDLLALAAKVARRVPALRFGKALVEQLLARITAHRANTLRVAGDRKGADVVWRTLRARLRDRPLRHPATAAELARLEASLRLDQRRFDVADDLLARALGHYQLAGDGEGFATVLIKRAIVRRHRGQPAAALPLLREAVANVDSERSPRRFLEVQHNLALCLCQLGRHDEAAGVVAAHRALYARFADPPTQLLLTWLEGRIARGRGDVEGGERHLLDARNRYLGQGLSLDAALVTLDLAEIYVGEGRTAEVKRLAEATVGVFADQAIHAEAERALRLFQRAAVAEQVTIELIARLRSLLERTRHEPGLPFEPSG